MGNGNLNNIVGDLTDLISNIYGNDCIVVKEVTNDIDCNVKMPT